MQGNFFLWKIKSKTLELCTVMNCLIFLYALFGALLPRETVAELSQEALEVREKAYAPYSQYFVGAALLGKSGKIYTGCNVENASYGLTICAERTAIFKAISEGEREFRAIAIVTRGGGTACGACRQVLNEFNPEMAVISLDDDLYIHQETTLEKLLPEAFGPSNLK